MARLLLPAVLLILVGYTAAKPSHVLDALVKALHRRSGECDSLADSADQFLNFIMHEPYAPPPGIMRQVIRRIAGIDLVQSSEMRRAVCAVTNADDLDELRLAVDNLGVTASVVRAAYNYLAGSYPFVRQMLEQFYGSQDETGNAVAQAALGLLDIVEEVGLQNLDPEGTAWVVQILGLNGGPGGPPPPRGRGRFHKRQASVCDRAHVLLNTLLDTLLFSQDENPHVDQVVAVVHQWSGINLTDDGQIRRLLCEILEISHVDGILDFLDSNGILNQVISQGYPLLVRGMYSFNQHQQDILNRWEEAQEGGVENEILERQVPFARVFVRFYAELAASGLLSLA